MTNWKLLHKKRLAILGQGYMGRHLSAFAQQLAKKHHLEIEIVNIDRQTFSQQRNLEFDYFICATGNTGDFRQKTFETIQSNIGVALQIFERVRIKEKLIFLSSTRVYGFHHSTDKIYAENDFISHDHSKVDFIYDGSKLLLESMAIHVGREKSVRTGIARLSNVYGRFEEINEATLLKKIIKASIENKNIEIADSSTSSKDYIHIDDAVNGIFKLLISNNNEVLFNIASGRSHSLDEVTKSLGVSARFDKTKEPKHCPISIAKAKEVLGFVPSINLDSGLKMTATGPYSTL